MTLPVEELEQILHTAAEYKKETKDCRKADFLGINMEGPFISPAKKGAQDARNILPCNVEICDRFLKASEGLVKFIGIAPEESEHAAEFIREVKKFISESLGKQTIWKKSSFWMSSPPSSWLTIPACSAMPTTPLRWAKRTVPESVSWKKSGFPPGLLSMKTP